ncbi:MAG: hypothetical protein AMJ94_16290 [Deltaproteobacteria bacterium SM23_61]|nr:MAG: hypothetical protein AMJ94_16290 [Deltaproteobacteria bacterium SM23_61]
MTDLFQVLGQQRKTGILNLEGDKKVVQVLFDKGQIVGVAFPGESGEETALGRRLIRGRVISAENWHRAYKQHKDNLVGLEKMLVSNGMVTKEDLTAALRLLVVDTIYGIFKWRGGSFRFETKPVSYDHEFVEPMNSEFLLLDVLRMVDEWPMIAERLPSFDIVLQKTDPMATLDALVGTPWEKNRTFQMDVIYDLIDGQRSISEIIELAFVEEFETCKSLILLMDAGLVESTSIKAKKARRERRKFEGAKYLGNAAAILLVGIFALLLFSQFAATRLVDFPFTNGERQAWHAVRDSVSKVHDLKIKNAAQVFFLEENRYAKNLSEMVERGLLPR